MQGILPAGLTLRPLGRLLLALLPLWLLAGVIAEVQNEISWDYKSRHRVPSRLRDLDPHGPGNVRLPTDSQASCEESPDCSTCFKRPGCGWCGGSGTCIASAADCDRGFSTDTCYIACPESSPMHDAAGVLQLGSQAPHPVYYLPNETCTFTIWPMPDSAQGPRHTTLIRLQFEYINLSPGDTLDLFSGAAAGIKLLTIIGNGMGVVNHIITSRSSSVVLKLNAKAGGIPGTGFRLYYRVAESSPLDIYLISAVVVTSILTCILCSCCCNNCLAMVLGQPGRRFGTSAHRSLTAEEKAALPLTPYDDSVGKGVFKECCICLSEFEPADMVRQLPCSHIFHDACIGTWLDLKSLCPLCKHDVRDQGSEQHYGNGEFALPGESTENNTALGRGRARARRHPARLGTGLLNRLREFGLLQVHGPATIAPARVEQRTALSLGGLVRQVRRRENPRAVTGVEGVDGREWGVGGGRGSEDGGEDKEGEEETVVFDVEEASPGRQKNRFQSEIELGRMVAREGGALSGRARAESKGHR